MLSCSPETSMIDHQKIPCPTQGCGVDRMHLRFSNRPAAVIAEQVCCEFGCQHGLCRGCPCTSSGATAQAMAVLGSNLRSNFLCDILALPLSHECHTAQC